MSDKRYYYAKIGEHWQEPGEFSLAEIEPLEDDGEIITVKSCKTLAGTELLVDSVLKRQVFSSLQEAVEVIISSIEVSLLRLGEWMDEMEKTLLILRDLK